MLYMMMYTSKKTSFICIIITCEISLSMYMFLIICMVEKNKKKTNAMLVQHYENDGSTSCMLCVHIVIMFMLNLNES